MGTNAEGRRGGRPRALAVLLALIIGWAFWGSVDRPASPTLGCHRPVGDPGQPQRVACSVDPKAPPPRQPLGVQRALGVAPDLNALSAEDFATLPGIGPRLAERIVEARRRQGGFRAIDDLGEVKGVGPAKLATLRAALEPPRR